VRVLAGLPGATSGLSLPGTYSRYRCPFLTLCDVPTPGILESWNLGPSLIDREPEYLKVNTLCLLFVVCGRRPCPQLDPQFCSW